MDQNTKPLVGLPPDILLQILGECDALDILNLSSACKRLRQISDEHQVWLRQARRLQIPIPPGIAPSKAELKDWVISRARVDVRWTKRRPGDLVLHSFKTDALFVDAHFIPGGEFVVLLYEIGDIALNRVERSMVTGDLSLREVARYEEPNNDDYPGSWSKLLTETSYGCPVLVLAGTLDFENPTIFLIDPVSQVIEKKQRIHCDLDGPDVLGLSEILAAGDRLFFICACESETRVTVVAEPAGPNSVVRRLVLNIPEDEETQFFLVSENSLVVTDRFGIHLYHVPELKVMDDDSHVVPIWSWLGDASKYRSTPYKTTSPYPALWLQGKAIGHTLEFDVDESGCFPVVVSHRITEGQPAYWSERHLKLQGRKGMGSDVGERGKVPINTGVPGKKEMNKNLSERGEIVVNTGVLGKPDITRQLRAPLPGGYRGYWYQQDEVKYTNLDEVTGRIMVVLGCRGRRRESIPYARWLCLADLPV